MRPWPYREIQEKVGSKTGLIRLQGRRDVRKSGRSWSNSILLLILSGSNCPSKQNKPLPLLDNYPV